MDFQSHPRRVQVVVLERLDAEKRMSRYYVLSVEPSLFREAALVREWGRVGRVGGRRIELHASVQVARVELEKWLIRKRRRGYVLRA